MLMSDLSECITDCLHHSDVLIAMETLYLDNGTQFQKEMQFIKLFFKQIPQTNRVGIVLFTASSWEEVLPLTNLSDWSNENRSEFFNSPHYTQVTSDVWTSTELVERVILYFDSYSEIEKQKVLLVISEGYEPSCLDQGKHENCSRLDTLKQTTRRARNRNIHFLSVLSRDHLETDEIKTLQMLAGEEGELFTHATEIFQEGLRLHDELEALAKHVYNRFCYREYTYNEFHEYEQVRHIKIIWQVRWFNTCPLKTFRCHDMVKSIDLHTYCISAVLISGTWSWLFLYLIMPCEIKTRLSLLHN